jgi:imidazole glycerol-phosphate synthase subunit HisF
MPISMLAKRIIPCLDVKDGMTVKGINFDNIQVVGDAVELATKYASEGADELVFLDITATNDKRKTTAELVKRIAKNINIPFTIGGGISSIEDVEVLLSCGADKVSVNSAAVKEPELIARLAKAFGSQCIVLAIDTKHIDGKDFVFTHGGKIKTDLLTEPWAKHCQDMGAGEILLTSMDHDGTKNGFAVSLLSTLSKQLNIPLIASGGAGSNNHFREVFLEANVDAALAASLFHYNELSIPDLKQYLKQNNILIR